MEAWLCVRPPAPRRLVPRHFFHVGFIIIADIFKIGKDLRPLAEDGVIAQIAVVDGLQHLRPWGGVKCLIFLDLLRLQSAELAEDHTVFHAHTIVSRSHSSVQLTI